MAFYKGDSKEAIRALQLQKRRLQQVRSYTTKYIKNKVYIKKQQEDIELKKKKIEEDSKMTSIDDKFNKHYDAVEQLLKTDTIGLVTLEDMKKKREQIIKQREIQFSYFKSNQ